MTSSWHIRISLAALCAMLVLPFLNPHHLHPIPTFRQEWMAAGCGLLAASLLLKRGVFARLEVPGIAGLPLALLALLLVQRAAGLVAFPAQALIFALYLLWALLLLVVGRSLRQDIGIDDLVTRLAAAILAGTLLATALLALQLTDPQLLPGWVFPRPRGAGNLGQTNHLANYLCLGLASAIYLHVAGKVGVVLLSLCALLLVSAASLTGSRSVIVYAAGFAALSLWAAWHFGKPALAKIARISVLLLVATLLLQWLFAYVDVGRILQASLSGERLFNEASGTSARLQLWRTGLAIFAEHPWLGAGLGQFPIQAYRLAGAHPDAGYFGGGEHAHNVFIHLLCELGPLAPLLAVLLGLRWWLGFARQAWSPAHWWIAAVLLVLAIHSQLEYPLWYAYFLGIAALVLGAGSASGFRPRTRSSGRWLIAAILGFGTLTLLTMANDYRRLEPILNGRLASQGDRAAAHKAFAVLGDLHQASLFGHYVELAYATLLTVDREALPEKIAVTNRAIRFSPVDAISFKFAYLLALDQRTDEATLALQRAVATHPRFVAKALKQLDGLAETYPELKGLHEQLRRVPAAR